MNVLITGGAGYIGSHTCVELLNNNHNVIVVDNFYNSKPEVLTYIKEITNKDITFYPYDVCHKEDMEKVFKENKIDAIIHFAGYKAVGESVEKPLEYYQNNLVSSLVLCELMKKYDCNTLVFSSSATVYGNPKTVPITEESTTGPTTNPYGSTKLMLEQILKDIQYANPQQTIYLLRYFNPIGAHESGLLGEEPNGIPNNLMPYIMQVANGTLEKLGVFGDDYDTPDGTGVRDYIHVVDLAKGHVKALESQKDPATYIYNLGTGIGYSVLDIVKHFEKATGQKVPYQILPRRAGDIAACYADPTKAKKELGWEAEKDITEMCKDSWHYASLKTK
ncbi:MAG: UDP-glucose 4-epimerase GalE [Coprobacillaceae bacterium]